LKAAVGGTFNVLHVGHKALISRAFALADEVIIGISSDRMARATRKEANPYGRRKEVLEGYAETFGKPYQIHQIDDIFGPAAHMKDLDFLVASEWSQKNAEVINRERVKKGLSAVKIEIVPTVLASDFRPVSSTRIMNGEIDADGKLKRALRIRVGTSNPVKVEGVRRVFGRLYDKIEVEGVEVETGVPQQPREDDVIKGAMNRARSAIGGADIGVGVEAGLLWDDVVQWYFDVQYCVIVDSSGRATIGHGPGFWYPPEVIEWVEKGLSVNDAMQKVTGIEKIGHTTGAVGYLSKNAIDRTRLTEMAVLAAFIPRIRPELYTEIWRKI
jgi:inosine/xanthosine triphosphatase/pantetheine-phosphate adenylyltransferase